MSITYYAETDQELIRVNIMEGEIALYTGTIRDGLRTGPTANGDGFCKAYVYRWAEGCVEDICTDFMTDYIGAHVLDFTAGEDRYIFVRNETGTYLRQILGPDKPVVVGNIGAEAIRVDTLMGKFVVPAGTVLRLDQSAPLQRERQKVLLNFACENGGSSPLKSALLLEAGRWRPLNICASKDLIQVKDGAFSVQELRSHGMHHVKLCDPPDDPDYEIYFRLTADWSLQVQFAGLGAKDEGLTRTQYELHPTENVIYDFQLLRRAPTAALMAQCTAQLPCLEAVDPPPEQDVPWPEPAGEKTGGSVGFDPFGWPAPPDSGASLF